MGAIVVTGTDTGVGKTFVAAALCHACREAGLGVRALKPVESGVGAAEAEPHEDGVILAAAAGQDAPRAALQRLAAPLAPPVAADLEGVRILDEEWRPAVVGLAADADIVLVEAAGGLLSPMSRRFDALTLARHLEAPLLVVARDALGTINHTRLVLEVAERHGVAVLGVVLSAPATPDTSTGRNARALREAGVVAPIIEVARHDDPARAAGEIGAVLGWLRGVT